ncbi:hypothetical protein [Bradyrhizobium sp. OAE829]|uniref:hypothetical protein n=1 Tax=Bradyrhizobium sp. OAE829 TaxID=2663807 RepID=UPI0017893B17
MTLIVAAATPDIGFLVSDTLVTTLMHIKGNPTGPVNGEFHTLKVQILNPRTAVAFATSNAVDTAIKLISEVHGALQADPSLSAPDRLFEAYKRAIEASGGKDVPDCEFLVLTYNSAVRKLARVSSETITYPERAYIGDANEYKKMMELRQPYVPPAMQQVQQPDGTFKVLPLVVSAGEIEFEEISLALETLVNRCQGQSVGAIAGCIIRVVDAKASKEIEYLQLGEAGVSPEEGQTGFSVLASNTGKRGIGIYYKRGKIGFVMNVGDCEYCRVENAPTIRGFIEVAKAKYGLELSGPT